MGCHNTSVSLAVPWGMGNEIKTKAKQMQNLWPICKCCFWGYLFLCIPRARWGMLVYCRLGYLILSLSMTCNSFFFLKGFENDLRWTEELPFGFRVPPAKLLHIHFVTITSTRSFSAGLLPRKSGPSLYLCMGTKLAEVEGLCCINDVPVGPFLQTVKVPLSSHPIPSWLPVFPLHYSKSGVSLK